MEKSFFALRTSRLAPRILNFLMKFLQNTTLFLIFGMIFLLSGCVALVATAPPILPVDTPYVSQLDDPESNALFHFTRAQLLLGDGDVDGAIKALQAAIGIDPEAEELRFRLAEIYGEVGRMKEARRSVEDILISNPESVRAHQILGHIALGNGEPAVAAKHFRTVMELDPDNEMVPLQLSIALVRIGEAGQAIEELKHLLERHPDSRPGRLTLARLYRDMNLNILAEEHYRYLIDNLTDIGQAYLDLGFMYEEQHDWKLALELFNEALQKNPHDFALRHHIARIYVGMKRFDDALRELQTIVHFDANDLEARRKIGLVYMEQERWDDAIDLFKDLLVRDQDIDAARYYLGSSLERTERWDEAFEAFSAIPETSALYEDAVSHMGFLLMQTDRLDEAVSLLEMQMEMGGARPQFFYYLAAIHLTEKRLNEALAVLEQGTQRFPDNTDLLYQEGLTLERMGRHDQAIEVMHKVIALDAKHAEAMNFVAYAYADTNTNLDEALTLVQRAIKLKPAGHIHDTLGWVYYRLGRFEEARQSIEEASRLLLEDEVVLAHLAEIYMSLKAFEQARDICRRLLELDPENTFAKEMLDALDASP